MKIPRVNRGPIGGREGVAVEQHGRAKGQMKNEISEEQSNEPRDDRTEESQTSGRGERRD